MSWQILTGDCRTSLATLPERSVQTCVTSPPYFGLRDYGHDGQIGLEPTPDEFVAAMVAVFREVRRVLRDDGTMWLNLGDSYASGGPGGSSPSSTLTGGAWNRLDTVRQAAMHDAATGPRLVAAGCKPKDLIGIPWMVAFALRADGWYLRSDIIWSKPNPMPESVTDRPTKAHEYLFLLSKSRSYLYDADAVRESAAESTLADTRVPRSRQREGDPRGGNQNHEGASVGHPVPTPEAGRNKRSVWTVATQPFPGAHFATFPPKLIEPCILAGSAPGDVVLDPFAGSGTTGMVALRHDRSFVGCELSPEYVELARQRIVNDSPLLNSYAEAA